VGATRWPGAWRGHRAPAGRVLAGQRASVTGYGFLASSAVQMGHTRLSPAVRKSTYCTPSSLYRSRDPRRVLSPQHPSRGRRRRRGRPAAMSGDDPASAGPRRQGDHWSASLVTTRTRPNGRGLLVPSWAVPGPIPWRGISLRRSSNLVRTSAIRLAVLDDALPLDVHRYDVGR
jgi:hypothetical protein